MSPTSTQAPGVDAARRTLVDSARQEWVRKLIDVSRRNNLLYFRQLKTGTLDFSAAPSQTMAALLRGEAVELLKLVSHQTPDDDVQVAARVQEIRRRALTNLEERGLSTLFVSLGMASWAPEDEGRPPASPVFLLPVLVENKGREGRNPVLRATGELQVNEVLLHVLEEEHGISISGDTLLSLCRPSQEEQSEGPSLAQACKHVGSVARKISEFTIESRAAFLGNFSFQKLAMVKDLQQGGELLAAHDMVAALAGHLGAKRALSDGSQSVEPSDVDRHPAAQEFLVLDADSSQQAVVATVLAGKDGVIQGPPGTGKSQTIANLVAELAARGKRVLFVAEKRAALEVVLRRLENEKVGLGHLVLDLHGADVDRRKVLARLSATLDHVHEAAVVDVSALHARFEKARARLSGALHRLKAMGSAAD